MNSTARIGILYICTGRYDSFWDGFYQSCEDNFATDCEKEYFVFTDSEKILSDVDRRINKIDTASLPWPLSTLMRYRYFLSIEDRLDVDYLVFFNANALFVDDVSADEFLPDNGLVAVKHYWDRIKHPSDQVYERSPKSTACVDVCDSQIYCTGSVMGGKKESFLKACKIMNDNTDTDLNNNFIALWHDESHWNRYLIDSGDVRILSNSFSHPEGWVEMEVGKIILREKEFLGGNDYMRGVVDLLQDSDSDNYRKGCHLIGDSYYHGLGDCKKDDKKAFEYWLKAAEAGHEQCIKNVAWAYSSGIGCEVNEAEYKRWSAHG